MASEQLRRHPGHPPALLVRSAAYYASNNRSAGLCDLLDGATQTDFGDKHLQRFETPILQRLVGALEASHLELSIAAESAGQLTHLPRAAAATRLIAAFLANDVSAARHVGASLDGRSLSLPAALLASRLLLAQRYHIIRHVIAEQPGQVWAYTHFFSTHRGEAEWVAMIDADEFINPAGGTDLHGLLAPRWLRRSDDELGELRDVGPSRPARGPVHRGLHAARRR